MPSEVEEALRLYDQLMGFYDDAPFVPEPPEDAWAVLGKLAAALRGETARAERAEAEAETYRELGVGQRVIGILAQNEVLTAERDAARSVIRHTEQVMPGLLTGRDGWTPVEVAEIHAATNQPTEPT